jgi:hypothetical protein
MTFRPGRFEASLDRLEAVMMRDPIRKAYAGMTPIERQDWQQWRAQLSAWHSDKTGGEAYELCLEGKEPPPAPKAVARAFGFDKHYISGCASIEQAAQLYQQFARLGE